MADPKARGKHSEWIVIGTEPKTPSPVTSSILMEEVLLRLLWETEENVISTATPKVLNVNTTFEGLPWHQQAEFWPYWCLASGRMQQPSMRECIGTCLQCQRLNDRVVNR